MATLRKQASKAIRDLDARARAALRAQDLESACSLYSQLEQIDARNPEWPRQLASLHQRAGCIDEELDALVRCADRHAVREEFLPALATYKMVLSTDPGHLLAQQRLSELQPSSNSVSVHYVDQERAPRPAAPREPVGAPPDSSAPSETAPLDELVLTQIIEGARPARISAHPHEGIHEIPLGPVVDEGVQLGEAPLFSSLDEQSLAELIDRVRLVELAAGEELFHQGDRANALYVVAQGAVVPIAEGPPRTRLAVLEAGEFFGEIALFTNQPRNATVEALVDSQLLEIDRAVMWKLVQEHSQVLSLLLQFLRARLIDRLVRTSSLFQIFSTSQRSAIARRFRFLEVSDGHAVIEQHHPTDGVFILLSGHMDVVHHDDDAEDEAQNEKVLASLGPGELFGEMSLLWREPSLASVVARGKCWLLALPADSFREMLDHHPQLAELAAGIAEKRREQNKRTLRDALGHRDGRAGLI